MTLTDKINAFIEVEGHGNIRDALNVALSRLERAEELLKESYKQLENCRYGTNYERDYDKEVKLLMNLSTYLGED